jgi:hypothetical protein
MTMTARFMAVLPLMERDSSHEYRYHADMWGAARSRDRSGRIFLNMPEGVR